MTLNTKKYVELFPPQNQKDWRWPAIANFIFGGAGAGFYCFHFSRLLYQQRSDSNPNLFLIKLLGPIMIAFGFMFLPIEAGRPSRSFHLIRQYKDSWISREIIFFLIFLLTALGDYFFDSFPLYLLSVGCAVGFIFSQGFIVYDSKAVTAWSRPVVPWVFLSSSISSGASVALFLTQSGLIALSPMFIMIVMFSIAANAITWLLYLFPPSGHNDEDIPISGTTASPSGITDGDPGHGSLLAILFDPFSFIRKSWFYLSTSISLGDTFSRADFLRCFRAKVEYHSLGWWQTKCRLQLLNQ